MLAGGRCPTVGSNGYAARNLLQHFDNFGLLATVGFHDGKLQSFAAVRRVIQASGRQHFLEFWLNHNGKKLRAHVDPLPNTCVDQWFFSALLLFFHLEFHRNSFTLCYKLGYSAMPGVWMYLQRKIPVFQAEEFMVTVIFTLYAFWLFLEVMPHVKVFAAWATFWLFIFAIQIN